MYLAEVKLHGVFKCCFDGIHISICELPQHWHQRSRTTSFWCTHFCADAQFDLRCIEILWIVVATVFTLSSNLRHARVQSSAPNPYSHFSSYLWIENKRTTECNIHAFSIRESESRKQKKYCRFASHSQFTIHRSCTEQCSQHCQTAVTYSTAATAFN